jgi:hypothetical protein
LPLFVTTIGLSFLLAVVIGFVRIDPWVRASLVSLVIMRIFALPFIARPQIDIEAAYWFGVALLAFGAWLVGVLVGVVARALLRRIATVQGGVHTPHRPFSGVRHAPPPKQPEKTAQPAANGSLGRLIPVCRPPTMSRSRGKGISPLSHGRRPAARRLNPGPGSQKSSWPLSSTAPPVGVVCPNVWGVGGPGANA